MGSKRQFSPEARERAVRMLEEHRCEYRIQWDAICSIATMIGCSAESLQCWLSIRDRSLHDGTAHESYGLKWRHAWSNSKTYDYLLEKRFQAP